MFQICINFFNTFQAIDVLQYSKYSWELLSKNSVGYIQKSGI